MHLILIGRFARLVEKLRAEHVMDDQVSKAVMLGVTGELDKPLGAIFQHSSIIGIQVRPSEKPIFLLCETTVWH